MEKPLASLPQLALLGFLMGVATLLFAVQGFQIDGPCMQPHLYTGERVAVNKIAFLLSSPRRGDVVVFHYPRDPRQMYIKRVVGLPGDIVSITGGQVSVDSHPLPEQYKVRAAHGDMAPQYVPHDQYFVLGDNRDQSDDSRDWGDLPRANIVGRAASVYWPPARACVLK